MPMIKQSSIEHFLDELASRKATPGGGSAAGVMGAMAAALLSMVCNLTIGKAKYRDFEGELNAVLARTEQLRGQLTEMIQEDVESFGAVIEDPMQARRAEEMLPCPGFALPSIGDNDGRPDREQLTARRSP